jgi:hypothetical protein
VPWRGLPGSQTTSGYLPGAISTGCAAAQTQNRAGLGEEGAGKVMQQIAAATMNALVSPQSRSSAR